MRISSIILSIALAATVLQSGCATTGGEKPAVCDGRHRRPANPYGTVLPVAPLPGDAPAVTKPATPSQTPPSAPSKTPGPMSRLDPRTIDPKSFDPCGRAA